MPEFVEVGLPTDEELHALLQSIITRLMKLLTRHCSYVPLRADAPRWAEHLRQATPEFVAAMATVPAAEFATASMLAERGGTPVEVALAVAGPFEGSAQHVIQVNQSAQAPSASRVTVLRDGLHDDSIRGDRWEVLLKRTSAGSWAISEVKRAWRCRRGAQPDRFATVRCP